MFVTADDFGDVPYAIPGLSKPGISETFASFIDDEEDEQLRKLVGVLFYDALKAAIEALPDDWAVTITFAINDTTIYNSQVWKALVAIPAAPTNTPPVAGVSWSLVVDPLVDRWIKLRDGENYQIGSITKCPTFRWGGMGEMVRPMIYSLWLGFNARSNTGQGVVVSANENSELVSSAYEIAKAWRKYYKLAGKKYRYFGCNVIAVENTFYGYIVAVAANFNDVITDNSYDTFLQYIQNQFRSPGTMNEFDI